jgi:hypothetical protein
LQVWTWQVWLLEVYSNCSFRIHHFVLYLLYSL